MSMPEMVRLHDDEREQPLSVIHPASFQGKPVPTRQWAVKDWIPMKYLTLLYGDGGSGKSLLAMQLLTSASLGKQWLGHDVPQMRAFGLFCEDDKEELHIRQDRINAEYGCEFCDLDNLLWRSGVGEDNVLMHFDGQTAHGEITALYYKIEKAVLDFGAQMVVLDTAADIFGGGENIRPQVRTFLNLLGGLALKINGAVAVCAHPSQSGMSNGRGDGASTAWSNTARSRLYFEHVADDDTGDLRTLSRKKSNYAKKGEQLTVRYSDGVFVPEKGESALVEDIKARNLRRYIVDEVEKRQDTERWLHWPPLRHTRGSWDISIPFLMPCAFTRNYYRSFAKLIGGYINDNSISDNPCVRPPVRPPRPDI